MDMQNSLNFASAILKQFTVACLNKDEFVFLWYSCQIYTYWILNKVLLEVSFCLGVIEYIINTVTL